jgi:hypothetical protein
LRGETDTRRRKNKVERKGIKGEFKEAKKHTQITFGYKNKLNYTITMFVNVNVPFIFSP